MTNPEPTARIRPIESSKISDAHRAKLAVVYVRQLTPQQVAENRESLARQYALADHAISLGWPTERVLVIDEDLGLSGRTADMRLGFQRLLAEVSMDHVGLVLGLEMSLRREQEAREGYDRFRRELPRRLSPEDLERIRALATDIPSLWRAADTTVMDRKEIVRAIVERVTVTVHGNTEQAMLRIDWIGGTSIEHPLRRPISRYERLDNFPRMRSLVLAGVAAGQTAEEIAECLNREGFRPPSCRVDRFTPELARGLVYRLGLSPRRRPVSSGQTLSHYRRAS